MKKNRLTRSKKLIILLASAVLVLALLALIAPFLILAGLFQTNPTSHPSQAALGWLAFDYTPEMIKELPLLLEEIIAMRLYTGMAACTPACAACAPAPAPHPLRR